MVCAVEKKGRFHSYSEVTQDHTKFSGLRLCEEDPGVLEPNL